jgi:hypothetical protein
MHFPSLIWWSPQPRAIFVGNILIYGAVMLEAILNFVYKTANTFQMRVLRKENVKKY